MSDDTRVHRVTAGPYTLALPTNGVAILYDEDGKQLSGGVGYLAALVQFAGEVIRLNAENVALRERCAASDVDILLEVGRNEALEEAAMVADRWQERPEFDKAAAIAGAIRALRGV